MAKIEESGTFNFGGLNLFVLSKTVILPRDSRESRGTDFHTCGAATFNPSDGSKHKGHHGIDLKKIGRQRNAKQLWASLRPRLRALVQLQRQWGKVHDMYHVDVHHETADLSRWIRDPDSNFSQAWDIAQVCASHCPEICLSTCVTYKRTCLEHCDLFCFAVTTGALAVLHLDCCTGTCWFRGGRRGLVHHVLV